MEQLLYYHRQVIGLQSVTALVAKLPLLLALIAVHGGNQKPGRQVLSAVLAAHFLIAFFLALDIAWIVAPIAIASLALAAACGALAAQKSAEWRVLRAEGWAKFLGFLLYAAAFLWPFHFTNNPVSAWSVLASPMAIMPHLTLLVALGLLAATGRAVPQFFAWTALGAALVIGGMEAAAGTRTVGVVLLIAGLFAAWGYWAPAYSPSATPKPAPPEKAVPRREEPAEEAPRDSRKWNLK